MQFTRVGDHTIKCVISEDEIQDLGYSVEEIVTNSERTQEFMNHIFDMAEQEFQTKFEMGVKTVQVEFRSDRTLTLTFSEHPTAGGMLEHLKDIIGGLLNTIPQEKWEEYKEQQLLRDRAEEEEYDENEDVTIVLKMKDLDEVISYAKKIKLHRLPLSWLGKLDGVYYLFMELVGYDTEEVKRLSILSDEYVFDLEVGACRLAYFEEHEHLILQENAVEILREM